MAIKNKRTQAAKVVLPKKCCNGRKGQKVSVKQYGKKLIVDFAVASAKSFVCEFDGCLVNNYVAPDFAISDSAFNTVFVELKGKDVIHALAQLEAGFEWWIESGRKIAGRSGVIVCNEVPRVQTRIQLAKNRIAEKFGAAVHIFSRDVVEESFARLLKF